jgi:hypothetical protein
MYIEWTAAFALMLGMTISLIALGIPVAFAFLCANLVGVFLFMGGEVGFSQLVYNATSILSNFALMPSTPVFDHGRIVFPYRLGATHF